MAAITRMLSLARSPLGAFKRTFDFFRRWPVIPGLIIGSLAIGAIFAGFLTPYDPKQGDLTARSAPPAWVGDGEWAHPLGTDRVGRDMLSRLLYGARVSLMVAGVAVSVGTITGTLAGLLAGYVGGMVDELLMRLVDLWSALPFLLIALIVAVSVGPSLWMVIGLLALSSWSAGARNVRGEVLSLKTRDYVALAKVAGASHTRIMYRHLLPQVIHVVIVITTLRIGSLIIAEAGLSFLGVGVPASVPTWGIMIAEGRQYLLTAWWIAIFPGMAIFATVTAFNFLGDWARDRLDPRLRQLA